MSELPYRLLFENLSKLAEAQTVPDGATEFRAFSSAHLTNIA